MAVTIPEWLLALKGHKFQYTDEIIDQSYNLCETTFWGREKTTYVIRQYRRVGCVCGWVASDGGAWEPWSDREWEDHVLTALAKDAL